MASWLSHSLLSLASGHSSYSVGFFFLSDLLSSTRKLSNIVGNRCEAQKKVKMAEHNNEGWLSSIQDGVGKGDL